MIELTPKLLILIFLVFLFGLLLGILLLWRVRAFLQRLKIQKQYATAKKGETDAEKLLIENGYTIVARQARTPLQLLLDGLLWETDIIADIIAEKEDKTFIAEVKTGSRAPDIRSAPTRRQLLEYYVTYKPDGILLLDMTSGVIHTVEFLL